MEELVLQGVNFLISIADKYNWFSYVLIVIGGLYVFLSASRAFLTCLVNVTKTDKDNKVVNTVFAFLDKYGWGFGSLADYYEQKVKEVKENK